MAILAFDMGGSAVKYGIWNNDTLEMTEQFKTPATWDEMKDSLNQTYQNLKITYDISGIALSAPGSVDVAKGVIGGISAIEYIHHFPIVEDLESVFGLPVSIDNDANCAALAETWKGVARGESNVLFVVVGTGIGGAVIVNGEIQRGHNLFGGEFGCMILDGKQSFSMLGTAVHMAERYARRLGIPEDSITGAEVFDRAKAGDARAIDEVNKFYDYLSLGLYNLQFTTDPSSIIIGGGVSQNPDLIPAVTTRIQDMLSNAGLESVDVSVKACHFLNDANLVGAVAAFQTQKGAQ